VAKSIEWFLFVHNLNRIVNFWDLFLVEINRKISQFFICCLNNEQIKQHLSGYLPMNMNKFTKN
jgi:hypothetical protein